MIGAFTIDIGGLMTKLRERRAKELETIAGINASLGKIYKGEGDHPKDYGAQPVVKATRELIRQGSEGDEGSPTQPRKESFVNVS